MNAKDKERYKSTSCGGVVWRMHEGKLHVLLIKQFAHKDRWGIPKGHTQYGETLEDCALREIHEETGVTVMLGARLQDMETSYRNEDKTVVSFLAQVVGDHTPRSDDPDSEVADARWWPADALPELYDYQRPLIINAIALISRLVEGHVSSAVNTPG